MEAEALRAARGSAYISVQSLVTTLMGAVAFAFVARILTQTEMGVAVGLMLIMGALQILSDFGFGSGLAKYVAEYRGKNEDYTLITFAGICTKVFLAGFFALACALLAPQLSSLLLRDIGYAFLFQLLGVDIFFVCIFTTVNKLLLGLNRFLEMAILSVIAVTIRQLFVVGLLIFGYGLRGLVGGWILGDFTYVVIGCIILLRGKHIKMHSPKEVFPHMRKLISFSWPLFLTDTVLFLYTWFDRVVLLAYIPLNEVAIYNVAYTAFGVLYIIPTVVSTTLLPFFSEQYGKSLHGKIVVNVNASTRYIVLIFTPLALGMISTATPVLTLFAGKRYAGGDVILATLSLFGGVAGMGAAFSVLLLVYDMTLYVLIINLISTGFGVISSLLFLQIIGSGGVAIVKGIAMVMSLALTVTIVKRHLPIRFDKEVLWKSWSAALLMWMIVELTVYIFPGRYLLPVYILIGGIVYFVALRILKTIKEDDFRLARNFMGKKAEPIINFLEKVLVSRAKGDADSC